MADRTRSSIVVAAPAREVMAVIADFAAYPEWTGAVKEATVVTSSAQDGRAQQVRFRLDAGPIKDDYTLAYEWDNDHEVRWTLVDARLLSAMDGSYTLQEQPDGSTEVTYTLSVDIKLPLLGRMKRNGEKIIIDTALKGLKRRVEGSNERA
jgi:ribosome-associated toxin RatA of RatAB toxin-antitoxin module